MILPAPLVEGSEVAEHYDCLNQFYQDVWGLHRHHGYWQSGRETPGEAIRMLVQKILEAAGVRPGGKVVDVGCGSGGIAWFFAEKAKVEVVGYTVSREEARTAGKHGARAVGTAPRFIHGDWLDNQLADGSADAVLMIESFSHMADRQAVLVEIARVLKPGGRLVMADWVASTNPKRWQVKGLLQPICRGGRLTGLNTFEGNRKMFEVASLLLLEHADLTASVSKTWRVIAGRSLRKVVCDASCWKWLGGWLLRDRPRFFAIPRVMLAYALGCLRYQWMVAEKGSCGSGRIEAEVPL